MDWHIDCFAMRKYIPMHDGDYSNRRIAMKHPQNVCWSWKGIIRVYLFMSASSRLWWLIRAYRLLHLLEHWLYVVYSNPYLLNLVHMVFRPCKDDYCQSCALGWYNPDVYGEHAAFGCLFLLALPTEHIAVLTVGNRICWYRCGLEMYRRKLGNGAEKKWIVSFLFYIITEQ